MLSRSSRSTRQTPHGSPRFNTATPGLPAALRAGGQAKIRTHKRPEQRVMLVCVDLRLPWRRPTAAAGRPTYGGEHCVVLRGIREIRGHNQPVCGSPWRHLQRVPPSSSSGARRRAGPARAAGVTALSERLKADTSASLVVTRETAVILTVLECGHSGSRSRYVSYMSTPCFNTKRSATANWRPTSSGLPPRGPPPR